MPKQKLQYFNAKGRAELARIMYAYRGVDYEDERLAGESWQKEKPNTPFGQLPVLVLENGTKIAQSNAIFRYLARELDLYSTNNVQSAMIDVVIELINDVFSAMIKAFFEKDEGKKAELDKDLMENVFPKFLQNLETMLKANGGKFLVGDKITLADLAFFDLMNRFCERRGKQTVLTNKVMEQHYDSIEKIPEIKNWLAKRPKTEN